MSELFNKIHKILESRGIPKQHTDRVEKELSKMLEDGVLEDLFVIYQKIEQSPELRGDKNVLNSMVSYLLGITSKEPDGEFHLEKRRTYGRAGFPDIDMDFDYARRHEIEEYLRNKYGQDYVGQIGTIQTLKSKSAVRRVVKVLDPDRTIVYDNNGKIIKNDQSQNFALQNTILKSIPDLMKKGDGSPVKNLQEAYDTFKEFREAMDKYPEVFRVAKKMEGSISSFGIHAAGILLSPVPLKYLCPLHVTTGYNEDGDGEKTIGTQFSMSDVESLGLIKMDVLGLSTKTAISLAKKWIKQDRGIDLDLNNLSITDPDTLKLLTSGKTDGCFQLENTGMKQTLQQIGIDSFDDLIVAIAMYRPGPKDYIPEFAKRKRNPSQVSYVHPIVEKYTKKTYGIIVYQEQAMQIFVELAGLTPSEGYIFIKGSAKKNPELFQSMKQRFIEGASKKSNKQIAEAVWKQMEPFQGYAFNKSHACSYAYESWRTAYLKSHFTTHFMAARMTVEAVRRNFDDVIKYESDCRSLGIKVYPPDINRSKLHYLMVSDKELLRPLLIKGIGDKAAEEIVLNQPYKTNDLLVSFSTKVGKSVNSKVMEALCDVGIFGEMKKNKVIEAFETIKKDRAKSKGRQIGDMFS